MMVALFRKLAWDDPVQRPIAEYLRLAGIEQHGKGEMRMWGTDIFSQEVRERSHPVDLINQRDWNEWSGSYL
jgi:hypothetical protein